MNLCKYKNIFGAPNEGVHSHRFMGLAIVDVLATFAVAILLSYWVNKSLWVMSGLLFGIGIVMHHVFCVRTTIDKLLFPK